MTGPLWETLPDGWQTGQVKHAATVTLGKMLQSKDSGGDIRAPYMRAANVQPDGALALDDVNEMWFREAELEQLSVRAGDVVVVEGGQGGFGRAAYVDEELSGWGFQNSINRLRPIGGFDGRFIAFYLIALRASGFVRAYSNVVSMPHLTAEKLARIPIPLPPPEVQRNIADYLDRETGRIDTLIEEQQRLIEMLRERRKAVIAETTTEGLGLKKGLLKPCAGPLWERLPAGWRAGQAKHAATVTLGKMLQSKDSGGGVRAPYMRAANVQPDGALTLDDVNEMWFDPTELVQLSIRAGDVVVVEGGQGGFGRAAYVDEDLPGWGFQNSINRIRPMDGFDGRFIAFYLLALRASGFMRAYSNVVSMPHLTADKLSKIPMPLPPLDEQRAIADYLDEQTAKIDTLIAETERFIELARERRAALITAAVTGQIDVREAA